MAGLEASLAPTNHNKRVMPDSSNSIPQNESTTTDGTSAILRNLRLDLALRNNEDANINKTNIIHFTSYQLYQIICKFKTRIKLLRDEIKKLTEEKEMLNREIKCLEEENTQLKKKKIEEKLHYPVISPAAEISADLKPIANAIFSPLPMPICGIADLKPVGNFETIVPKAVSCGSSETTPRSPSLISCNDDIPYTTQNSFKVVKRRRLGTLETLQCSREKLKKSLSEVKEVTAYEKFTAGYDAELKKRLGQEGCSEVEVGQENEVEKRHSLRTRRASAKIIESNGFKDSPDRKNKTPSPYSPENLQVDISRLGPSVTLHLVPIQKPGLKDTNPLNEPNKNTSMNQIKKYSVGITTNLQKSTCYKRKSKMELEAPSKRIIFETKLPEKKQRVECANGFVGREVHRQKQMETNGITNVGKNQEGNDFVSKEGIKTMFGMDPDADLSVKTPVGQQVELNILDELMEIDPNQNVAEINAESRGNFEEDGREYQEEVSDIPDGMGLRTGRRAWSEELELLEESESDNVDMGAGSYQGNPKNMEIMQKFRKIFSRNSYIPLMITKPSKINKLSGNERRNLCVTGAYMQDSCQIVKFVEGRKIEYMLDGKEVDFSNCIDGKEIVHMCSSCNKCNMRMKLEDIGELRSTTNSMRKAMQTFSNS